MGDPRGDSLDEEYRGLVAGAPSEASTAGVPALLIRRARGLREPLLGHRARYLMTSHSPDGEWLAHGWKDDLRIVSEVLDQVDGIDEPAVWIQDERDYYGDRLATNRFAVGVSRIWLEQYVSTTLSLPTAQPHSWLDNLNRNPNTPELRSLQTAEGHPDPVGRRVVLMSDTVETDLRAVSPVRMTDNGDLALTVLPERDWYRWSSWNRQTDPHPSLRWEPATSVWVE
jgi:hypothetical protein